MTVVAYRPNILMAKYELTNTRFTRQMRDVSEVISDEV